LIFNTPTETFDSTLLLRKTFIDVLEKEYENNITVTYKAAMHAGAIFKDNGKLDTENSNTFDIAKSISAKAAEESIFASEQFSNALALYRQNIRFEPVGVLSINDQQSAIRLYKIKRLHN